MALCRLARPRRRCVRCERPKCTWARRSQFSPAARVSAARDPPPASIESRRPGYRPAAPRLGFFDLRGNELVAYTRCAQASSRRVEPRRRRRPVRARNKDKRHSCILMAGRARNTDGTHPRASSGARSVVSGPFPEVLPPAWRRASSACDRTDPTERSRSRPGRRRGRRHAAPRNLGRAGRAFVGPPNRWGIH